MGRKIAILLAPEVVETILNEPNFLGKRTLKPSLEQMLRKYNAVPAIRGETLDAIFENTKLPVEKIILNTIIINETDC